VKTKPLGTAEWGDYLTVCDVRDRLIEKVGEVKRLLKTCAPGEEAHTITVLKELCGVK
jgi:hypothetical protein